MMELSLCVSLILIQNTHEIGTVGVELSSVVTVLNVELGLVDDTSEHPVVVGLEELSALDGALGHDASAVALLGAPSNFDTLAVTNCSVGIRRGEETEICEMEMSASGSHDCKAVTHRLCD